MTQKEQKTVNFTNVERKQFDLLPDGDYTLEVEKAEIKEGAKGDYFNLTLIVADGEFEGRRLWHILSTAETALGMMMDFLIGMGYTEEELREAGDMDVTLETFIGQDIQARVGTQKGTNGYSDKNVIKKVYPYVDEYAVLDEDDDDDEPTPAVASKSAVKLT